MSIINFTGCMSVIPASLIGLSITKMYNVKKMELEQTKKINQFKNIIVITYLLLILI